MSPNIGIQYYWSPINGLFTSNSSSTIANPITTTNYTLTAYNPQNGCFSYDTVLVTVDNSVPLANAGADFMKTCTLNPNGAAIGTTAVAANTYSWSPSTGLTSATAANPIANPTATTTYTLTAINTASGCTATDQVIVTVNNAVPLAYAGIDLTISCNQNVNGAVIGNLPEAGLQYSWSPTNGLSNANSSQTNAMPSATTLYSLTATNPVNGCTASDTVFVTVNNSLPSVDAVPNTAICEGSIVSLNGTANTTNTQWTPSSLVSNPNSLSSTATIQGTTTFTLTATGLNGCTSSDFVIITVNDLPQSGLSNNYEI
jgi:hypothetical protein